MTFNPAIQLTIDDAAGGCKRFVPAEERSVKCRYCGTFFFKHSPSARRFDSVFEMHRAYLSDAEILKWLFTVGKTLEDQLKIIQDILVSHEEVVNAPDTMALQAIEGIIKQLIIERDVTTYAKKCLQCSQPLPVGRHYYCFGCGVMATSHEGATAAESPRTIQNTRFEGADDAQVPPGAEFSGEAFD